MPSPSIVHRSLAVPRAGSEAGDYEDATAVAAKEWPVRGAVADGATESAFARAWAERLTQGLADRNATTPASLRGALPDWRGEWRAGTRARAEQQPWYVTAKAAEGAFAALLGVSLHPAGQWRAVSIGDCCLFLVRDGALLRSWPFEAPEAFTNRPALVSSRPDHTLPPPETATGTWQPRDTFLLATDAVAAWLLGEHTSGPSGAPLGPSDAAGWNQEDFQRNVDSAREEGDLRNDDATVLVMRVTEAPDPDAAASTVS